MVRRLALVLALCAAGSCTCGLGSATLPHGEGGSGGAGGGGATGGGGGGPCVDADRDGTCADKDCDDADADRHPGVTEDCDAVDQDCDGKVDDGLFSCPTCDCGPGAVVPGGFDPDEDNSTGVGEDPSGHLVLNETVVDLSFAWIANGGDGTVSKIDTRQAREVARYPSARPWNRTHCDESGPDNEGNCPSRTAVDGNGDVWVANRAFFNEGSVTKIANLACPDKNDDGEITTSKDLNSDGRIDVDSAEFPGDADECVLFTIPLAGATPAIPRGLALDAGGLESDVGSAWVGLFGRSQLVKLRNDDGEIIGTFDLPKPEGGGDGLRPYGAAIDRQGRVWVSTHPQLTPSGLAFVQASTGAISDFIPAPAAIEVDGPDIRPQFYGIAVDEKDRVWLGGWGDAAAIRYDHATGEWKGVKGQFLPGRNGNARGLALERRGELSSRVWVAFSTNPSRLNAFDAETLEPLGGYDLGVTIGAIGVGLDESGKIWAVNQITDNASFFDPTTGKSIAVPVGPDPYTYSDFTGYARRNFTAPRGNWRKTFDACPTDKKGKYKTLDWQGSTPPGTRIELFVRVADTFAALAGAEKHGPYVQSQERLDAPVDLLAAGVPEAQFAMVEAVLRSESRAVTPVLESVQLVWTCPGPDLD